MARFIVDKIYPKFIATGMTKTEFAELAGISRPTLWRALDGEEISDPAISKIAKALELEDVMEYLDYGKRRKENVTITRDDGTTAVVELTFREYSNGDTNGFAACEERDGDFEKAMRAYLNPPVKVEELSSTSERIVKKISGGNSKSVNVRMNAEIKAAESQGYYLAAIYVAPDGKNDKMLVFEKDGKDNA